MNNLYRITLTVILMTSLLVPAQAETKVPGNVSRLIDAMRLDYAGILGLRLSTLMVERITKREDSASACLKKQPKSLLTPIFEKIIIREMTPAEIDSAVRFFEGATGKKFVDREILQVYQAMKLPLPHPMPELTEQDKKNIRTFTATTAGYKLFVERVTNKKQYRQQLVDETLKIMAYCRHR